MKRLLSILICIVVLTGTLASCTGTRDGDNGNVELPDGKDMYTVFDTDTDFIFELDTYADNPAVIPEFIDDNGVRLNYRTVILEKTRKFALSATDTEGAENDVTWKSSNEAVATVNNSGEVTAVGKGVTVITAYNLSGKSAECSFEVKDSSVTSITMNYSALSIEEGKKVTVKTTVLPSNASDFTLMWKSSDESIAKVDSNGTITAIKEGSVNIKAEAANGVNVICKVTVKKAVPNVENISFGKSSDAVDIGKTISFSPTISPSAAAGAVINWTSSNNSVASVSSTGIVTGKKAGSATITATAPNGKKSSITVSVGSSSVNWNTGGAKPVSSDIKTILNSAPLNPTRTGIKEIDELVDSIFNTIFKSGYTTYDKTKACYDYIIRKVKYSRGKYYWTDYKHLLRGKTYGSQDTQVMLRAYDLFMSNQGVCNDYSAAFMVMARAIGLECYYVEGYTNNVSGGYSGHMWNVVKINGTLYVFDLQVEDNVTDRYGGVIQYNRFCKTFAQMGNKLKYLHLEADMKAYKGFKPQ